MILQTLIDTWREAQTEAKGDSRTAWQNDQWSEANRHDARAVVYERCANELECWWGRVERRLSFMVKHARSDEARQALEDVLQVLRKDE